MVFQIINHHILQTVQNKWRMGRNNKLYIGKYSCQSIQNPLLQFQMEVGLNFINEDNPAMASNTLVLPLPFLPVNIRCFILSLDNGMRISSKCRTFSIVKAEINNWFTVPSLKYQCTPGIAWCSGLRDAFCQPFHPSYHKKTSQGIPWKVLSCHILS